MTINRENKTADEIKAWMDNQLHKDGNFKEYQFFTPKKWDRPNENYANWTFLWPGLYRPVVMTDNYELYYRRNNDSTFKPIEPEAVSAATRIWALSTLMFDVD